MLVWMGECYLLVLGSGSWVVGVIVNIYLINSNVLGLQKYNSSFYCVMTGKHEMDDQLVVGMTELCSPTLWLIH